MKVYVVVGEGSRQESIKVYGSIDSMKRNLTNDFGIIQDLLNTMDWELINHDTMVVSYKVIDPHKFATIQLLEVKE